MALDQILASGVGSLRDLAAQYGLSKDAIRRHKPHVAATITEAAALEAQAITGTLLEQVRTLQGKALAILALAEAARAWPACLGAIRECRALLEFVAKLTGEMTRAERAAAGAPRTTSPRGSGRRGCRARRTTPLRAIGRPPRWSGASRHGSRPGSPSGLSRGTSSPRRINLMLPVCTACTSPNRAALNTALATRAAPLRALARTYGVSKDILARHRDHIPAALAKATEAAEVAAADTLLARIEALQRRALRILDQAEREKDWRAAIVCVKEVRECLGLIGEVNGELGKAAEPKQTTLEDLVAAAGAQTWDLPAALIDFADRDPAEVTWALARLAARLQAGEPRDVAVAAVREEAAGRPWEARP